MVSLILVIKMKVLMDASDISERKCCNEGIDKITFYQIFLHFVVFVVLICVTAVVIHTI